ncbi:hypothetical protein MPL3365_180050 [Mesorhizobium plurifarium]|uniref:Uncharacterized protein n=1 Tax=Mesorhizobium plurifarium TaxID=69974 RepID=A0A090G6K6_MESPL|nr:hypothetical protein MPL3365_180050 [Mesorhizobium plurifarium]
MVAAADHDRVGKGAVEAAALIDLDICRPGRQREAAFDDFLLARRRVQGPAEGAELRRRLGLHVAAIELRAPKHCRSAAAHRVLRGGWKSVPHEQRQHGDLEPIHRLVLALTPSRSGRVLAYAIFLPSALVGLALYVQQDYVHDDNKHAHESLSARSEVLPCPPRPISALCCTMSRACSGNVSSNARAPLD